MSDRRIIRRTSVVLERRRRVKEKKEYCIYILQRAVTVVVTIYVRLNAGLSHGLSMPCLRDVSTVS